MSRGINMYVFRIHKQIMKVRLKQLQSCKAMAIIRTFKCFPLSFQPPDLLALITVSVGEVAWGLQAWRSVRRGVHLARWTNIIWWFFSDTLWPLAVPQKWPEIELIMFIELKIKTTGSVSFSQVEWSGSARQLCLVDRIAIASICCSRKQNHNKISRQVNYSCPKEYNKSYLQIITL